MDLGSQQLSRGPAPASRDPQVFTLAVRSHLPLQPPSPTVDGLVGSVPLPPLASALFCLTNSQNAGLHPNELSSLKSLAGNLIDFGRRPLWELSKA